MVPFNSAEISAAKLQIGTKSRNEWVSYVLLYMLRPNMAKAGRSCHAVELL